MDLLKNLDNMITAKEFLKIYLKNNPSGKYDDCMIEFAKLHVEAALKQAEEIAIDFDCEGNYDNSILNCYLLQNIK